MSDSGQSSQHHGPDANAHLMGGLTRCPQCQSHSLTAMRYFTATAEPHLTLGSWSQSRNQQRWSNCTLMTDGRLPLTAATSCCVIIIAICSGGMATVSSSERISCERSAGEQIGIWERAAMLRLRDTAPEDRTVAIPQKETGMLTRQERETLAMKGGCPVCRERTA